MLNKNVTIATLVFHRDKFNLGDWRRILAQVAIGIGEKKLSLIAAGVAFFAMLALFPAITAVISIFGYVADPAVVQENMALVEPVVPQDVYALVNQQVTKLVTAESQALGLASILSLLLAIWSARAGITAMMAGLNLICREQDTRNFFWSLIVAYSLTVLLIGVTLIAIASVVIVPTILSFFPLGGIGAILIDVLRWALAVLAVVVGIGALYRYGPSRSTQRLPIITMGNVLASLAWIAVSVLFSIYLGNFANYNQVYGSLGAVIALLMWFYLSAFVVLLGAELNAEIEDHAISVIRKRHPQLLERNDPLAREMAGEID